MTWSMISPVISSVISSRTSLLREQPWDRRRAFHSHRRWHQDLVWIHRLTLEWLQEAKLERPSHFLGTTARPEVRQSILALESVTERALRSEQESGLEGILDDTSPDDLLGRLENSVWTLQAWSLKTLTERSPEMAESLEQASWRHGRSFGEFRAKEAGLRPPILDMRIAFTLFADNPLLGDRKGESLLVCRAIRTRVECELRDCPHTSQNPAVRDGADLLCRLHGFWMKGLLYGIDPGLRMTGPTPSESGGRCQITLELGASET